MIITYKVVKIFSLILFIMLCISAHAQQSQLSKGVNYISEFIASEYFEELSRSTAPLSLVDTIYSRALVFNNYNISETLLSLTFGVIPYNIVPIKIPVIGVVVNFPLTSACDSVYRRKNKNLPANLFLDTPKDNFGDKDKLAHFFGNAFLSYSQTFFDLTKLIGYFVECFEEAFKVQSVIDTRDLKANELGSWFGKTLKYKEDAAPSLIMKNKELK